MRLLRLSVLLILCFTIYGCGDIGITTDVQSEDELLSIMEESGEYYFYETFDEDDFLGLFCNEDKECVSEIEESSDTETVSEGSDDVKIEYVLNTSTKKFHLPECSSASKIKSENISKSSERDVIISSGYNPCKLCNP